MLSLLLVLACRVLCIVPRTDLHTSGYLVCLFSPELMAFQVKHIKVEKYNKTETGFIYVGIVDRKTKMELEPPPPALTTLTTQDKKLMLAQHR
jgi:hypothetical protein